MQRRSPHGRAITIVHGREQACMWSHLSHDTMEFHVLGAWAPTYYHSVLGVPLARVGQYLRGADPAGLVCESCVDYMNLKYSWAYGGSVA